MNRYIGIAAGAVLLASASFVFAQTAPAPAAKPAAAAGPAPTLVVETNRGVFEITTFPETAPKTVAHIVGLAKRGFYSGIVIHRVAKDFVVQFGDGLTKDPSKKAMWGTGGSGPGGASVPIGVAEISKKHTHDKKGVVAMAHSGNPAKADSQLYITLRATPQLDSDYTVWGEVTSGMDVVEKTVQGDVVKKVTVK